MKLGDLRKIFEAAEHIYREAGSEPAADALKEVSSLCDGRESMTVAAFAKLVASQRPTC
jgi:hypothetical protein